MPDGKVDVVDLRLCGGPFGIKVKIMPYPDRRIVPICENAKRFAALTVDGRLTLRVIRLIREMGIEVTQG